QLRARLPDRLRRQYPYGVSDLTELAGAEEDAVTGAADAELAAALEHRADRNADVGLVGEELLELLDHVLADLDALLEQHLRARNSLLFQGVPVHGDDPAEQALVDALAYDVQRQLDELLRLAVVLSDDHVLRDVDETPRQVARVGRAQRRVGPALGGAGRRDEVLEHRQAFHEVRLD